MFEKNFFLVLLIAVLACSCVSRKQLTYFQPITSESAKEISENLSPQPEPRAKINDALTITISALDPEAVSPYNMSGYVIDKHGNIEFPILGKLHVLGMTEAEIISLIQRRLEGQVVNPMVTVRFVGTRFTILGEVRAPGSYPLHNGRITILEALGAAGDLTQYANRANVLITRENNGKVEFARLDLRSDEIFTSPYFYLQQNDVIYVEPNQARSTSNQSVGLWLSLAGTLSSAATVIVTVLRYNQWGK